MLSAINESSASSVSDTLSRSAYRCPSGTATHISSSYSRTAPAGTSSRDTAESSSRSLPSGVLLMRRSRLPYSAETPASISLIRSAHDSAQMHRPPVRCRLSSISPRASRSASSIVRAYRSRISPCSVRRNPFPVRSNNSAPSSLSRFRMVLDTAGCATFRLSAARVIFSYLATAANCRSWYNSIAFPSIL